MVNSKLIKEGEFDQIYQLTKEAVDLVAAIREENCFSDAMSSTFELFPKLVDFPL